MKSSPCPWLPPASTDDQTVVSNFLGDYPVDKATLAGLVFPEPCPGASAIMRKLPERISLPLDENAAKRSLLELIGPLHGPWLADRPGSIGAWQTSKVQRGDTVFGD